MISKSNLLVITILIFIFSSIAVSQNYQVKVTTTNDTEITGLLLNISSNGVRIDPDGPVSFRFIKSDDISKVFIVELNKELTYPLDESLIPAEVSGELSISTSNLGGFPNFSIFGAIGQSYAGGDYYEGFDSGMTYHFRGIYFFPNDDRYQSRFFISFSYYNSTIAPEQNSIDYYGVNIAFDDIAIDHYALEFGRTTDAIGNDSYLFFLFGLAYLNHEIKATGENYYGDVATISKNEDKFALRFEGGGVIGISPQLGLALTLGVDLVLSKNENNDPYSYNSNPTTTSGSIINFAVGLNYDF